MNRKMRSAIWGQRIFLRECCISYLSCKTARTFKKPSTGYGRNMVETWRVPKSERTPRNLTSFGVLAQNGSLARHGYILPSSSKSGVDKANSNSTPTVMRLAKMMRPVTNSNLGNEALGWSKLDTWTIVFTIQTEHLGVLPRHGDKTHHIKSHHFLIRKKLMNISKRTKRI